MYGNKPPEAAHDGVHALKPFVPAVDPMTDTLPMHSSTDWAGFSNRGIDKTTPVINGIIDNLSHSWNVAFASSVSIQRRRISHRQSLKSASRLSQSQKTSFRLTVDTFKFRPERIAVSV